MRIAVLAFDTLGGIQPYIALSHGLTDAGHDVTMVTPASFAVLVTSHGVKHVATTGDTEAGTRQAAGVAEMSSRNRNRFMREQMRSSLGPTTNDVLAVARNADVLLGGVGGSITGRPVAELLEIPWVDAHLQPLGPPTDAFPGTLVSQLPAWSGGLGRRVSHQLTNAALQTMFGAPQRQVRAYLNLPRKPRPRRQDMPAIYGFSPLVVPQPSEWGPTRKVTGYWTLPAQPGWLPPQDLVDFITAGPPPVCIGFGSMASRDPEALTELVIDAVRAAGVRAVLLSGWGGLANQAGDDILVAEQAPHDWLYPQMAAVVHHGGAGTTGAALQAGIPAVVVPFAVDQPFWGSRVAALGVGPTPIPRKRLTAHKLAHALRATVADHAMNSRAAQLSNQIRTEDGVGEAVRHLAHHLN
jgi:sterol 3beta-glucosyltransferase